MSGRFGGQPCIINIATRATKSHAGLPHRACVSIYIFRTFQHLKLTAMPVQIITKSGNFFVSVKQVLGRTANVSI
jgi:hypothetical protein